MNTLTDSESIESAFNWSSSILSVRASSHQAKVVVKAKQINETIQNDQQISKKYFAFGSSERAFCS